MCLGIPGKVVEILNEDFQLAKVDVSGVKRVISISLLNAGDEQVQIGDWVLIHVGFAMSIIDEERAQETMRQLEEMGDAFTDEIAMLKTSQIE
jgi:hydrogenase expression/formation protein HypC